MLYPFSPFSLNRRLSVLIIMFMILISSFPTPSVVADFPPSWLREGTYARYDDPYGYGNGKTLQMNSFHYDSFRWECLSLEENIAIINVSIITNQMILFSTRVDVNVENRSVTFSNGTYIGKTWLWLPANPSPDERIEVTDNQSQIPKIGGFCATYQSYQKIYDIGDAWIGGFYDLDTGLAISLHTWNEPTLLAMGVWELGNLDIADTNVDLDPREWWVEIVYALPIIAPVVGFVGVFAFVWHRRQQKRKQAEALTAKQRKPPRRQRQPLEDTNPSPQDRNHNKQ